VRLGRAALKGPLTVGLAVAGALVAWLAGSWSALAMAVGGVVTWARWRARHRSRLSPPDSPPPRAAIIPLAALAQPLGGGLAAVFLTHLWIGSVLFGGGYVLVALLQPYAVERFGWLSAAAFLDGVALTQAVPGPISPRSSATPPGACRARSSRRRGSTCPRSRLCS
jgi:chromate transporter